MIPFGSGLHAHAFSFYVQSEKDSREEILKAFRLFDDDETVRLASKFIPYRLCQWYTLMFISFMCVCVCVFFIG